MNFSIGSTCTEFFMPHLRLIPFKIPFTSITISALANLPYLYALKIHGNQRRKSGELYINHPLSVAYILATLSVVIYVFTTFDLNSPKRAAKFSNPEFDAFEFTWFCNFSKVE